MVWVGLSEFGPTDPYFLEPGIPSDYSFKLNRVFSRLLQKE